MSSEQASKIVTQAQDCDSGLHVAFHRHVTMDAVPDPLVEVEDIQVVEVAYCEVVELDNGEPANDSNSTVSVVTLDGSDVTFSDVTLSDLTDSYFTDSEFTASDVTDIEMDEHHGARNTVDNSYFPDCHLQEVFAPSQISLRCPLPDFNWADSREVWENMLKKERDLPRDPYMLDNHPELSSRMRSMLLNWLLEVCDAYKLHRETFCQAVDFTDRYLSLTKGVLRTQLQLIGVSALFLAAKQEEIYPPKVIDFAYVTDSVCSVRDILRQEMIIVKVLKWKLCPMTTNAWLGIFLQLVNTNRPTDPSTGFLFPLFSNFSFVQMSRLCDLCLMDLGSLDFPYSNIAAAVLFHYTRNEAILDLLNLNKSKVSLCVDWMAPFAVAITEAGQSPVKSFPDTDMKEFHTLQTHNVDMDILTRAVSLQMVYLEQDQEQEVPLDLTNRQA